MSDGETPGHIIKWVATDPEGRVVGEMEIFFFGKPVHGPSQYSVRYGYFDGQETRIIQRQLEVPSWQSLNIMGLTAGALFNLSLEEMSSDNWPRDQWKRERGAGSVLPKEITER